VPVAIRASGSEAEASRRPPNRNREPGAGRREEAGLVAHDVLQFERGRVQVGAAEHQRVRRFGGPYEWACQQRVKAHRHGEIVVLDDGAERRSGSRIRIDQHDAVASLDVLGNARCNCRVPRGFRERTDHEHVPASLAAVHTRVGTVLGRLR